MNNRIKSVLENLGYEKDNIIKSNDDLFDYYYALKIDGIMYNIIGIKYFDESNEEIIKDYHKKYWNQNAIPVSIVILNDEIRIYNNYDFNIQKSLLFSSNLKSKTKKFDLEDLKTESINSGNFFEKFDSVSSKKDRVDSRLLKNLEETINTICKINNDINETQAFDFITKCILIKYLEDREIIALNTFKLFNVESFTNLLEIGNSRDLLKFFYYLKEKFQGDIFENNSNNILSDTKCLQVIASFFKGEEVDTGQFFLFPYDFSIIPIELISSIYERFFYISNSSEVKKEQKKSGSFYTPYYLVNFIVNRELKLNSNNYNNVKVLDPSCGSGVFLVAVLKRIVKYYYENDLKIDGNILKNIVENQIFGIDNNAQALKIAEFSLTIATLDCLDPKDIEINNYIFPKLKGSTLFCNSCFDENICNKRRFDYVIGNPPWHGHDGDHVEYCNKNEFAISDKQIAQAFVYRASDFLNDQGIAVFILPNGMFYNKNAEDFRKNILNIFSIYEILNLGSIKNELFCGASYPCSIMVFGKSKQEIATRITNFTPNVFSRIFNKIVFDFTNSFYINRKMFEDDRLWGIALNGNYFDYLLLRKMTCSKTIKDICSEYSLRMSQGYARGSKHKQYDKYIGYDILTDEISNFNIERNQLSKQLVSVTCERIHDEEQYEKHNKLIIRRTISKKSKTNICSFYTERLIYNNKFYCIYDPNDNSQNIDLLYYLEAILNSKYYFYYQFYNSTSTKNSPPEIRKSNVESFPIVDYNIDREEIRIIVNSCKSIHSLYNDYYKKCKESLLNTNAFDEDDKIDEYKKIIENNISKLYGLNSIDEDTVDYTMNYAIDMSKGIASPLANSDDIQLYCDTIKRYFDELLGNENEYVFKYNYKKYRNSYIAIFSIQENNTKLEDIDSIIQDNIFNFDNLFVIKSINGFSDDYFYTLKTAEKSNWNAFKAYVDYQKFVSDAFKKS